MKSPIKFLNELSAFELRQLFSYNPDTGEIYWIAKSWLGINIGDRAGKVRSDGYRYVADRGRRHLEHRLAWVIHTGEWPNVPLDHKDGNKSNNKLSNLRLASVTCNNRNRGKQSNNTSGYKGVSFHKSTGKYHAKIMCNKKQISLGYFDDPAKASLAYQQAAKRYHNEFARF